MSFRKILLSAALFTATAVFAADLPAVKILATGGTIAGTAASNTQTTGYKAGDLGIQTLIEARNEGLRRCVRRADCEDFFQQHGYQDTSQARKARQ